MNKMVQTSYMEVCINTSKVAQLFLRCFLACVCVSVYVWVGGGRIRVGGILAWGHWDMYLPDLAISSFCDSLPNNPLWKVYTQLTHTDTHTQRQTHESITNAGLPPLWAHWITAAIDLHTVQTRGKAVSLLVSLPTHMCVLLHFLSLCLSLMVCTTSLERMTP